MAYAEPVERELDYGLCRYGESRLEFRGPQRRLIGDFVAVLGGTETFGRYVEAPFPDLLQTGLGIRCVNFGQANAGPDVFLNDPIVMDACTAATVTILQITGAQNMSNRFYKVHPRRNDRFVDATAQMRKVFPTVDFTEFHYTRHMLTTLELESPERFRLVRDEIRRSWVSKMNQISNRIRKPILLFWLGDRTPDDAGDWIGAEMKNGLIRVHGNGGGQIGAGYRGSLAGMKNGTIIIDGSAGLEVGLRMRRGIIVIGGRAKDFTGLQMKGGTIVLMSGAEIRTGAWMNRGTIISLEPLQILPTFTYACDYNPTFINLYSKHLSSFGIDLPFKASDGSYQRYSGDLATTGKGEILVWNPA